MGKTRRGAPKILSKPTRLNVMIEASLEKRVRLKAKKAGLKNLSAAVRSALENYVK